MARMVTRTVARAVAGMLEIFFRSRWWTSWTILQMVEPVHIFI